MMNIRHNSSFFSGGRGFNNLLGFKSSLNLSNVTSDDVTESRHYKQFGKYFSIYC